MSQPTRLMERPAIRIAAASIHFAAAEPNFSWLETRASPAENHLGFDNFDFFPVQPHLQAAHFVVADLPGLGVEVMRRLSPSKASSSGKRHSYVDPMAAIRNW